MLVKLGVDNLHDINSLEVFVVSAGVNISLPNED